MNFKEEYERRLRRVCGVTDDSYPVKAEVGIAWGYYSEADPEITVTVRTLDGFEAGTKYFDGYDPYRKLTEALFAVEDE